MIRRLVLPLFLALALAACNGEDRESLSAGEDSLSRDQLQELTIALLGGRPVDTEVTSLPADTLRSVGTQVLRASAIVDYFETETGGIADAVWQREQDELTDVSTPITVSFAQNPLMIGFIEFESPEFDALLQILVAEELVDSRGAEIDTDVLTTEYTEGFAVESRLGEWSTEQFAIVLP